jgi:hypothetical protein
VIILRVKVGAHHADGDSCELEEEGEAKGTDHDRGILTNIVHAEGGEPEANCDDAEENDCENHTVKGVQR